MRDLAALVERQHRFLAGQDDERFILAVPGFLAALEGEPRLRAILDDLRREAGEALEHYRMADLEALSAAAGFRTELVALVPELEGEPADEDDRPRQLLAACQRLAARDDDIAFPRETALPIEDPGRGGQVLTCLGEAIEAIRSGEDPNADARPDLDNLARDLRNSVRRHGAALSRFKLATRTNAGVALLRLDWVRTQLGREPEILDYGEDALREHAQRLMLRYGTDEELLGKISRGELVNDGLGDGAEKLGRLVGPLRHELERLRLELLHRLDVQRSHSAIMRRFKARSELHDRARLAKLADSAKVPEHALRDELARYLFDQGLNPLSEATLGDHRPDVLGLSEVAPTFYVEAKQFSQGPERLAKRAIGQVVSTAGTLAGPPFAVTEAWLVVFRRGGRDLVLPDQLVVGTLTINCLVVDLGEPQSKGSKQRWGPVELSADQLVEGLPEADYQEPPEESATSSSADGA
jgi:hypothetical protein